MIFTVFLLNVLCRISRGVFVLEFHEYFSCVSFYVFVVRWIEPKDDPFPVGFFVLLRLFPNLFSVH